jgi:uncharacterized protein YjbI with pentapeptide repeats
MDERTEQKTVIERLGEQITELTKWIKNQWQTNPLVFVIVIILVGSIVWAGYLRLFRGYGWADWTEFGEYTDPEGEYYRAKTLWDLELLIIPIVLAIGAWWLNKSERETERKIAEKNREEDRAIADERRNQATLEGYLDRMAELLLEKRLRESKEVSKVRSIARTRTLAALRDIDNSRKGQVIRFLYETGLIFKEDPIISLYDAKLSGADLSGADLRGAALDVTDLSSADLSDTDLSGADLSFTNLSSADLSDATMRSTTLKVTNLANAILKRTYVTSAELSNADLSGAELSAADLSGADLSDTDLSGADLSGANLSEAKVRPGQLDQVWSVKDAILPNGTKHE